MPASATTEPFGPLIDAPALAARLAGGRPPTLLDVRWALGGPPGGELYAAGHIPGAVYVDLDTELADPPGPRGRHPLPVPERFGVAMRAKGVSAARPVVVYDDAGGGSAARAWWLLRYFGHPRVAMLDGGLSAWVAAGHELTRARARPDPGDFKAEPGGMPVIDADAAVRLGAGGVLLDARAPERFRGEVELVDPVAGHIPGARNYPATATLDGSGRLLPARELAERLAAAGVAPGAEVGAYCGSGVTAAQLVLALEVAGYRAALYPGSWSEWVGDRARPVQTETTSIPSG